MRVTFFKQLIIASLVFIAFTVTSFAQVSVTNVTPNEATTGIDITITGEGFISKPSVSLTQPGSTKKSVAKVKSFNATTIVATVGNTAVAGIFDVTVKVKSNTAVSVGAVTIVPPEFVNLLPASAAHKDIVTINGSHLGTTKGKVYVNGKSAPVKSWTNLQITFEMPKLAAGVYPVVIENRVGEVSGGNITSNAPAPPPPPPSKGPDKFTATINGAPFKSSGSLIVGVHANVTDLSVLSGSTPGLGGKTVQVSFVLDLNAAAYPVVITNGTAGALLSYTENSLPFPTTFTSALPGSTFTITVNSGSINGNSGTVDVTFTASLKSSGGGTATITNGVAKVKLVVS
ncbi:MAG: IPT/TIG domain-containing protein [Planctomycetota bacterium]